MIGTILNVAGILLGGIVGLTKWKPLSPAREAFLKVTLAAFTVFYGLRLTWTSFSPPFLQILKQLAIVVLALMLGRLAGRLLHLQKMSNRLGQRARERLRAARPDDPRRASAGFKTCGALFCAAPLGLLGAVQDGLSGYADPFGYPYPLAVKAVIDGLATLGFVSVFGRGVLLAALPVLAVQGSISLLCAHSLAPFLTAHSSPAAPLLDSVNAVGGLLVFCVALVMLELKRIELADYLPSLIFAPLLTWLWP